MWALEVLNVLGLQIRRRLEKPEQYKREQILGDDIRIYTNLAVGLGIIEADSQSIASGGRTKTQRR